MILKADYTDDNLIKLYDRRCLNNDFEGALSILDKLKLSKTFKKDNLYELYAKTYYKLTLYEDAIGYWFKFLSVADESQRAKAYNALGACYYKLEENSTAGYYFNEQLRLNRRGYFEYNNVGAEFFDDFFDNKKDYYIAYPYDKADFTKLLEITSNLIKIGFYKEAIDKLSIIPYNSKFYVDKLMRQSLCKYFLDDKKGALEDIDSACQLQPNNINAVCNAISLFLSVKNKNKVKEYLQVLTTSQMYNDEENAFKIALIYCELKEHGNAEKFLKTHLKNYPYDLTAVQLLGICYYNLNKFNMAIEQFKKACRLRNTYVFNYYLKLSYEASKKFEKGKKVESIEYAYDVQEDEKTVITKSLKALFGLKKIPKEHEGEVFKICDYIFENSSYNLQADAIIILNSLQSRKVRKYLLSLLLKPSVYDKIKSGIIGYLVADDYHGEINLVYSNLFKTINVGKLYLEGECTDIFKEAYSICVAKTYPIASDLTVITKTVNKMWSIVKNTEDAFVFDDVNSLSAVIFELSKIKAIKNRRDFINFFNANMRLIKKYKSIFLSYNFLSLEGEDDLFNEIIDDLL